MATIKVEKLGGFAGFGLTNARIRSRGQVDSKELSAADRKMVDGLFQNGGETIAAKGADGFRYRITRTTAAGTETIEADETDVPAALASCVKDEFV